MLNLALLIFSEVRDDPLKEEERKKREGNERVPKNPLLIALAELSR